MTSTILIELVNPQQTNHHGTLYGGTALALMDKTGFLTVSRYARRNFVTAASQQIDFLAPARKGQIVELTGQIARVGRTSITATVELVAEDLLSGARQLCTRGNFVFVAVDGKDSITAAAPVVVERAAGAVQMVEMIFPDSTNHHGTLYGGTALSLMGKAAYVAATRTCRKDMAMIIAERTDFHAPAHEGELVDLLAVPEAPQAGRCTVAVTMQAENLLTGERRLCTQGHFVFEEQ